MRRVLLFASAITLFTAAWASADVFGTGLNQFEIKFTTISGNASNANGTNISQYSAENSRYKAF